MSRWLRKQTKVWLESLFAAALSGAGNALFAAVILPEVFNTHEGLENLLKIAASGAVTGVAFFLKRSPLPGRTVDAGPPPAGG